MSIILKGHKEESQTEENLSQIWKYFHRENEQTECGICGKAFSSKTAITTLKYHLHKCNPEIWTKEFSKGKDMSIVLKGDKEENQTESSTFIEGNFGPTGKQTSSVWKFMQKGLDSTFCLICEKKFSLNSATTCLKKHLETKHGLDLKAGKDKPSPST